MGRPHQKSDIFKQRKMEREINLQKINIFYNCLEAEVGYYSLNVTFNLISMEYIFEQCFLKHYLIHG